MSTNVSNAKNNSVEVDKSQVVATYHGLEKIVATQTKMLQHLSSAIEMQKENGFIRNVTNRSGENYSSYKSEPVPYNYVHFADTFFTDTLNIEMLATLLRTAIFSPKKEQATNSKRVTCRFLFLNPFSDQAKIRALKLEAKGASRIGQESDPIDGEWKEKLDSWKNVEFDLIDRSQLLSEMLVYSVARTCVGTNLFCDVLRHLIDGDQLAKTDRLFTKRTHVEMLAESLSNLKRYQEQTNLNIEFRFTSDLISLPTYILGDYCYRGMVTPASSSIGKPWSIFRDDPTNEDDMWQASFDAFGDAWEDGVKIDRVIQMANEHKEAITSIMVARSDQNKRTFEQISHQIHENSNGTLKAIDFSSNAETSSITPDIVGGMLKDASAGIVLLVDDDVLTDSTGAEVGTSRVRQNVIHEMGLMQSKYGSSRVLLIANSNSKDSIDLPSNIDGMDIKYVDFDGNGMNEDQLSNLLNRFIKECFDGYRFG